MMVMVMGSDGGVEKLARAVDILERLGSAKASEEGETVEGEARVLQEDEAVMLTQEVEDTGLLEVSFWKLSWTSKTRMLLILSSMS